MRLFQRIAACICAAGIALVSFCGCQADGALSENSASAETTAVRKREAGQENTVYLAMVRDVSSVAPAFQNAVNTFNEENGTYSVVPVYYKDEASLQRGVIGGDAIDLIDLFGLSTDIYSSRGVLVDLYSYLDADADLDRGDFVPAFLSMAEQNGMLPFLSSSFSARTFMAPRALVGETSGWTVDEFLAAVDALPDEYYILDETTALDFFSIYLTYSIGNYVDLSTGEIHLDQDSFYKMMTFCKEKYRSSSQGTTPFLQYFSVIFGPLQYVDYLREQSEEYTLVGFPGAEGNGALRYFASEQIAISSLSENPDGAWEFLKYLVTAQPDGIGFPVLMDSFQNVIQSAMEDTLDENGAVEEQGMTEEERDSLLSWLDQAAGPGGAANTSEVVDIIVEEAAAYIRGDKTYEAVLQLMENRLSIYLSEQG